MGAGVGGAAMVSAVGLVAEVLQIGTERVTIHLQNTEETVALDHHLTQLPAICTVVQVCKYKTRI